MSKTETTKHGKKHSAKVHAFNPKCSICVTQQVKEYREVMALLKTHFPIAIQVIQRQIKMVAAHVEY